MTYSYEVLNNVIAGVILVFFLYRDKLCSMPNLLDVLLVALPVKDRERKLTKNVWLGF